MAKTVHGVERRARRSASDWRAEVAKWRASGLTASAYGKRQDLHAGTLLGWASRLGRQREVSRRNASDGGLSRALFVPVAVTRERVQPSSALKVSAEIVLDGGRRVRLCGELGLEQLRAVLDAVEERV